VTKPGRSRRIRAGIRGAFVTLGVMLVLLPALPAAASGNDIKDINQVGQIGDVGSPDSLSVPLEVLLFIGIPIAGFIIAALMAFRPQRGASRRYRPGRPWTFDPVWFGDESVLEQEPKRAALPGAGGASGRW
jgi:hypothetical protein